MGSTIDDSQRLAAKSGKIYNEAAKPSLFSDISSLTFLSGLFGVKRPQRPATSVATRPRGPSKHL